MVFYKTIESQANPTTSLSWDIRMPILLMRLFLAFLLFGLAFVAAAADNSGHVIHVGVHGDVLSPSAAAAIAKDGDVIEIDPGDYPGDVAVWKQNNLTIRGHDGMVLLDARGAPLAQGKAIWVISGNNTTISNIEFRNAAARDGNGAGIRQEGAGLHLSHCVFERNQDGILAGNNRESDILIEHSEFGHNGHGAGQTHNIYIGIVRSFEIRFSYVHHANVGNDVKSRAMTNKILYNRIMDEEDGDTSYEIDLPDGGLSFIIGNLIQKGRNAQNYHTIAFAAEGAKNPKQDLYVVNNTMVNDRHDGVFIMNRSGVPARIYNNIFIGAGRITSGPGVIVGNVFARSMGWRTKIVSWIFGNDKTLGGGEGSQHNLTVESADIHALMRYDYHLNANSPAINFGVPLESVDGFSLVPKYQYVDPMGDEPRVINGVIDAGAYEYSNDAASPDRAVKPALP